MTTAALLPVEAAPEEALRTYGRTFHWSARLLGREVGRRTRALYGFCRFVDDLADELAPDEAGAALDEVSRDLERGTSRRAPVTAMLAAADEVDLDHAPLAELVRAVRGDLVPARLETLDELVRYGYGVAGTVGLALCELFGAEDPAARPFAVDLGVGMQLTNVVRDVHEDALRGRVYLPAELLGRRVAPEELAPPRGDMRRRAARAREAVLTAAEAYYRSADDGLRYLPPRPRAAVATASRAYAAIGGAVRRRPDRSLEERAFVTTTGKLWQTVRALGRLTLDPRTRSGGAARPHDPALHRPLAGRPGADPNADRAADPGAA